jgi:deazaflavin-dependent oxidoreductase (nitroreductase family)
VAIPFAPRIARFSTRYANRILGPVTWYLPGFGRIEHVGRRSGTHRVSPMMAFRSPDGRQLTFALTYGPGAQWVRNVLAAGEFRYGSRKSGTVRLVEPEVVHDPGRRAMPRLVRQMLAVMHVDDFLVATIEA